MTVGSVGDAGVAATRISASPTAIKPANKEDDEQKAEGNGKNAEEKSLPKLDYSFEWAFNYSAASASMDGRLFETDIPTPSSLQRHLTEPLEDITQLATNMSSFNRLLHFGLGPETLFTKIFGLIMSEAFVLFIHEQAHGISGNISPIPGLAFNQTISKRMPLEATQVARNRAGFSMARNGANAADASLYAFATLDPHYQSLGLLRDINEYMAHTDVHIYGYAMSAIQSAGYQFVPPLLIGLLWQAIDPMAIASVYRIAENFAAGEHRIKDIPFLPLFGDTISLFPSTAFDFSPIGLEYSGGAYFRISTENGNIGGQVYLRGGPKSSRFPSAAPHGGAGIEFERIPLGELPLYLNVGAHVWSQPEFVAYAPIDNGIYNDPNDYWSSGSPGHFAGRVGLGYQVTDSFALEIDNLYKQQGWLRGYLYNEEYRLGVGVNLQL